MHVHVQCKYVHILSCNALYKPLQVELIIPGVDRLPPEISSLPSPSFYTASLPVGHFIQPDIINRYLLLNEGSLTALSVGRRIDVDDIYALLPSGLIHA